VGCWPARGPAVSLSAQETPQEPVDVIDVVLDIYPCSLPPAYELPLYRELTRRAPWLAGDPLVAVHPVRGARTGEGGLLLGGRAKLVIRCPRDKLCKASVLEGATLTVAGVLVKLGTGTFKRLQHAPTLYSARVVTGHEDESTFMAQVESEIAALSVRASMIAGRRSEVANEGRTYAAWSLALHDLSKDASLALQARGLGILHEVGCGILHPAKTISLDD